MNWHNGIYKRYTKKIPKHKKFYLVLVNFPWYNNQVSFEIARRGMSGKGIVDTFEHDNY